MKVTSQLINQFKRYLEQKSQETGETFDFDISSSIYEYSEEFEEFVEEKYGNVDNSVFSKGFDTKELQNISFKDGEFIADKSNKSDDAAFFAQMLNDLMENDEFKTSFDSDGDGKISEEEYGILLSAMNSDENKNITMNEFLKTLDDIQTGEFSLEGIEPIAAEDEIQQTPIASGGAGGGGRLGGAYNPKGNTQKTLDNMTANELNAELSKATKATNESKDELNGIINGTSEEISSRQGKVDEAYDTFQKDLVQADEQLSKDLDIKKGEVDTAKTNLADSEVIINEQTVIYTQAKGEYENAIQQINGLNSQISALEAELSAANSTEAGPGAGNDNASAIAAKIQEAKAALSVQEKRRDDNETAYKAAEEERRRQEEDVKPLYIAQLAELEPQLAELETKVSQIAQSQNPDGTPAYPELAQSFENYNNLKSELETYKADAKIKAQEAFDKNLKYQNEVQTKLNAKQQSATEKEYSVSGLKLDYNLSGVDFNVVGIEGFNSLEDFMNQVQIAGLTNTGKYGTMQCQNYSCAMIDLILGRANPELAAAFMAGDANGVDLAGYMAKSKTYNNREYHAARSDEGLSYFQILASELEQGRPCMVAIPRPTTGTHYGICVGIRDGADYNNLQATDFLIVDSYDGKPEIGGVTNSFSENKDVWVLTEGYRYENSGPKYVKYRDGQPLV